MKFICLGCDEPMNLKRVESGNDFARLTFVCPKCGFGAAMNANPKETQLIKALGLDAKASPAPEEGASRTAKVTWDREAQERLQNIPSFARNMAQAGIERYAVEKGYSEITVEVMNEAKKLYGM